MWILLTLMYLQSGSSVHVSRSLQLLFLYPSTLPEPDPASSDPCTMCEADNPNDIVPNSGPGKRKIQLTLKAPTQHTTSSDEESPPPKPKPPKKKVKTKTKASRPPPLEPVLLQGASTQHPTPPVSQASPALSVPAGPSPPNPTESAISPDPDSEPNQYAHRANLPQRATIDCAANHPHFKHSSSIAYHFLTVISSEHNADGEHTKSVLKCCW